MPEPKTSVTTSGGVSPALSPIAGTIMAWTASPSGTPSGSHDWEPVSPSPPTTRRLVERFAQRDAETAAIHRDLASLTPREVEVLALLARGLSNAELADRLHLSEATVKTHVARILAKLSLRDRVQAVIVAYETGLVSVGRSEDQAEQ